ncbi:GATA transcription factor 16 [Capsicum chinense]|nr:GATA transcription factor 16 [Capsicum chinense]
MNIPTYTNSSSSSFPFELNNNEVQYDLSQYNSYQFASSSSNSSCQNFFNISTTNIHDQSGYDHFHSQFHQPQHQHEVDNFGSRSSGSHDQLEKKNKGLKLTLWKNKGVQKLKNNNLDYTNSKLKLEDQNDYNNNNIIPIRVCSDCNTTKTPLWRSGPKGPKSLCNACGIRQRKARRAAAAAAAAATNGTNVSSTETSSTTTTITTTTKVKVQQQKNKTTKVNTNHVVPFKKRCKFLSTTTTAPAPAPAATATATAAATAHCTLVGSSSSSSSYNNNNNNNNNNTNQKQKLCFEDFFVNLSNNLAIHRVFPQDEKEAAILLMALSSGLVHG